MSSTPKSPPTRRIQGGLATLVGVLVAIAVAVALIAVTSSKKPTPRTSAGTSQANVSSTPHTGYLGHRQAGDVVNGGPAPAAAVSNTGSSSTVQANPDQQGITSHGVLPGWTTNCHRYWWHINCN